MRQGCRRVLRTAVVIQPLLVAVGCGGPAAQPARQPERAAKEPLAALQANAFRLSELVAPSAGGTRYLAQSGQSCSFEITIGDVKSSGPGTFDFAFAPAVLGRRVHSDCTAFLNGLAPTLGFRGPLPSPKRQQSLKVTLTILGTRQSRTPDHGEIAGSFSSQPPGNWTAMKLFLAEGEGEVFMNLNLPEGVGEFSFKDHDYATVVITELAKILLPEEGRSNGS